MADVGIDLLTPLSLEPSEDLAPLLHGAAGEDIAPGDILDNVGIPCSGSNLNQAQYVARW